MISAQNSALSLRFSTDGLSVAERPSAVREMCAQARLSAMLEPLRGRLVEVNAIKLDLPGLGIMAGTLSGLCQAAPPLGCFPNCEDELLIGVNLSGRSTAQQRRQELQLRDGDAMFATHAFGGFTIIRPTPVRFLGIRVPRETLTPFVGKLDDFRMRVVPHDNDALNLLVTYAGSIDYDRTLRVPRLRQLVAAHFYDLIAATLDVTHRGGTFREGQGVRAARLQAIIADITAHLVDHDLSAVAVSRRQRITPRYVHKLLEGAGLTFSAFVNHRRLSQARDMLTDRRPTGDSLIAVSLRSRSMSDSAISPISIAVFAGAMARRRRRLGIPRYRMRKR